MATGWDRLQRLHPHPRDARVRFHEDGHWYSVDGGTDPREYRSVTGVVKPLKTPFDGAATAAKMVRHRDFPRASRYAKYRPLVAQFGATGDLDGLAAAIAQSWQGGGGAAAAGSRMHRLIEGTLNGVVPEQWGAAAGEMVDEKKQFDAWVEERRLEGWEPFRTEWVVFDEECRVAGTIDAVFRTPHGLAIVDWKRAKEIKRYGFNRYLKAPCQHLQDCNFNHYALQLNLYRLILESKYGVKVDGGMKLVVLHPESSGYRQYEMPEMEHLAKTLLAGAGGVGGVEGEEGDEVIFR